MRLEEFEIQDELGAGGFGVTYLAQDLSLGRQVAVKEYFPLHWGARRPDGSVGPRSLAQSDSYAWGLNRFLDEARVLARPGLRHPNLVQVHRIIKGNGAAYLVTEFVEGRSLKEALGADGPWPEGRVRSLLAGLLGGLSAVHGAGLLHRDIKPANVMLRNPDETPVLIDFGAARYATGERSGTLTDVLTPGYAPLEQYHTKGRQGAWTDIYALGAVAYHLLSGQKPDEAPARVEDDPLRPVAEVAAYPISERSASAVDRALSVRAADRPQSVAGWREMLTSPLRGSGGERGLHGRERRATMPLEPQGGTPEPLEPHADEGPRSGVGGEEGSGSGAWGLPWATRWRVPGAATAAVLVVVGALVARQGAMPGRFAASDDESPVSRDPGLASHEAGTVGTRDPDLEVREVQTGGFLAELVANWVEEREERLDLDAEEVRTIQQGLAVSGFYFGPGSGVLDNPSRAAIRAWQEDRQEERTGYLTKTQAHLLIEEALDLRPVEVRDIQQGLAVSGFYSGPGSGVLDGPSRAAVRAWQQDRQEEPTGYLTDIQISLLMEEAWK